MGPVKDCGLSSALTPLDGFLFIFEVFIKWTLTDALSYCTNEVQAKRAPRNTWKSSRQGPEPRVSGCSIPNNLSPVFPLGCYHLQQALPPGGKLTISSSQHPSCWLGLFRENMLCPMVSSKSWGCSSLALLGVTWISYSP